MNDDVIIIDQLEKTYEGGFTALKNVNLTIKRGEIFALLGPNGAGKTTLIQTICGISNPTKGTITVDGHDIIQDYRYTRQKIGLVPQELTTDAFETVWNTVNFSRGLFGLPADPEHIEKILKDLSLYEKKDNKIMTLSGGMKRRLLIAKALSHNPQILFLDEPTAGVDVELRKDMWRMVHGMRKLGVTIILTTHYIEEAEDLADRIGIINKGEIIVVEEKNSLMGKFGAKQMTLFLESNLTKIPDSLSQFNLENKDSKLIYTYDSRDNDCNIQLLLNTLQQENIAYNDIHVKQSTLEEIFVDMVKQ